MLAVIGLLLCVTLGCSGYNTLILRNPPGFQNGESPRRVPCKICNTTNWQIIARYSAIEEEALKTCQYLYNGMKECPPNTRTYYNEICKREECYLKRGDECENNSNHSYRGIKCSPGVACFKHESDDKYRCGAEPYKSVDIRRSDETLKGLPLALWLPRFYEELAKRYGSSDDIQTL